MTRVKTTGKKKPSPVRKPRDNRREALLAGEIAKLAYTMMLES